MFKTVFFGTPEFAVPFLNDLIADPDFSVALVVSQPDKPIGRKKILSPTPVKAAALAKNIRVDQPESVELLLAELTTIKPDFLVVVAFGQIISSAILQTAKYGAINVHPSLLPKFRGASPIQSALLAGENKTGLTIMLMDEKMDHGPILAQKEIILTGRETNESLRQQITKTGGRLLLETLKNFAKGKIKPQEQDHHQATFCRSIAKEQARIDWTQSAEEIDRLIRAFYPWPIAWTTLADQSGRPGQRLKIFPPVEILPIEISNETGEATALRRTGEFFLNHNKKIAATCGQGFLILNQIQPEGKKIMSAVDFWRGLQIKKPVILT